jgi:Protein of unknown function (DUF3037)
MTDKRTYTYTVLRYVHDVVTGEFVNVGIVLHSPDAQFLKARTRSTIGRLRELFPDLDRTAFTAAMRAIRRGIDQLAKQVFADDLRLTGGDAAAFARRALPADDSSLQWSPIGTGLTEEPAQALERLYLRLVARYDERVTQRRSDDDVWRPVRQRLEALHLPVPFQQKVIAGGVDQMVFEHAWKNGAWHVYEPVSLDLSDAEGIKRKARERLGHLAAVEDGAHEPIKLAFVVGAPQNPELLKAYSTAISILRKAPFNPAVYKDDEIELLVTDIADQLRSHG